MGTIYIVKNPHYRDNYYKVGKTSKTVEDRLSDEKNPSAFSLEEGSAPIAEYAVFDLNKVENLIHTALSEYRIEGTSKKEWFKIELSELKKIIEEIISKYNFKETVEPANKYENLKEAEENFNSNEKNSEQITSKTKKNKGDKGNIFINLIFGVILFILGASFYQIIIFPILLFVIIKIILWFFKKS